ncbi:unnamed protein product [Effrenium voratum]|nr:unnamed protein product [Effrenium voratum]
MKRPAANGVENGTKRQTTGRVMHIYMCRHGTTTWNLAKKWQGQTDTELAPVGLQQAEDTAELLRKRLSPRPAPRVFCSDLKRAQRTAEIYAEALGSELRVEPRLREPSLGKFEGMTKHDIYSQYAELFKRLAKMDPQERLHEAYFEGLETPHETAARATAAAKEVFASAEDGEAVLFVTHSKVLEAVLAQVFGKFYEGVHTSPGAFFVWSFREDDRHELSDLHNVECHDYQEQPDTLLYEDLTLELPREEVHQEAEDGDCPATQFYDGDAAAEDALPPLFMATQAYSEDVVFANSDSKVTSDGAEDDNGCFSAAFLTEEDGEPHSAPAEDALPPPFMATQAYSEDVVFANSDSKVTSDGAEDDNGCFSAAFLTEDGEPHSTPAEDALPPPFMATQAYSEDVVFANSDSKVTSDGAEDDNGCFSAAFLTEEDGEPHSAPAEDALPPPFMATQAYSEDVVFANSDSKVTSDGAEDDNGCFSAAFLTEEDGEPLPPPFMATQAYSEDVVFANSDSKDEELHFAPAPPSIMALGWRHGGHPPV